MKIKLSIRRGEHYLIVRVYLNNSIIGVFTLTPEEFQIIKEYFEDAEVEELSW
jgi:hypothetical protein